MGGLEQVLDLRRRPVRPRLMWWKTTLTDAGHHAGGPGPEAARASRRDADARLGRWLDLLEGRGLSDDAVVLLTRTAGWRRRTPPARAWEAALEAAGVPFRDEAYGLLYLGQLHALLAVEKPL